MLQVDEVDQQQLNVVGDRYRREEGHKNKGRKPALRPTHPEKNIKHARVHQIGSVFIQIKPLTRRSTLLMLSSLYDPVAIIDSVFTC